MRKIYYLLVSPLMAPKSGKVVLHVQVDESLQERLEAECARIAEAVPGSRVTVSDVVRRLLERGLARKGRGS